MWGNYLKTGFMSLNTYIHLTIMNTDDKASFAHGGLHPAYPKGRRNGKNQQKYMANRVGE